MERCSNCRQPKPINQFRIIKSGKYISKQCLDCERLKQRKWRRGARKNPALNTFWSLRATGLNSTIKRRYGISDTVSGKELRNAFEGVSQCWLCGNPVKVEDVWFDHIIPVSKGGRHSIDNIQAFCQVCNELKNSLTLSELLSRINLILSHKSIYSG